MQPCAKPASKAPRSSVAIRAATLGYAEAHIEQGPWLEHEGKRIGVVTGIVGSRNFTISFRGQQNHAGTTPMALRRDAGHALVELAHRVYETFPAQAGERSVWTIGRIALDPGVRSIVPGRAEMHLQFRDEDEAVLDRLEAHARTLVAEAGAGGRAEVGMEEEGARSLPAKMDTGLRGHVERAAERHAAGSWLRMPSAAVHDAQILARHMPAAMMFVPSIGGIQPRVRGRHERRGPRARRSGVRHRGGGHAARLNPVHRTTIRMSRGMGSGALHILPALLIFPPRSSRIG